MSAGLSAARLRDLGVSFLTAFATFGTLVSTLTCVALLFPGGWLEPMWRLNPPAHTQFLAMGNGAILLMVVVAIGCALVARGLWIGAEWGRRLAVGGLVVNLIGDLANAIFRGDLRTLIGLPIGGAMIAYLLSARAKSYFSEK